MSYFDDVIEPALLRGPKIPRSEHRPTDASEIAWRSKDGRSINIGNMEDSHLRNAHKLLGSRIGMPNEKRTDLRLYGLLRSEINNRLARRKERG